MTLPKGLLSVEFYVSTQGYKSFNALLRLIDDDETGVFDYMLWTEYSLREHGDELVMVYQGESMSLDWHIFKPSELYDHRIGLVLTHEKELLLSQLMKWRLEKDHNAYLEKLIARTFLAIGCESEGGHVLRLPPYPGFEI